MTLPMVNLPTILDGETLRPQTRQDRRLDIQNNAKASKMFKRNQLPREPKPLSKKGKVKVARHFDEQDRKRENLRQKELEYIRLCAHVAVVILQTAIDLAELVPEELQWFTGGFDGLVTSLARDHQVVDKNRPMHGPTESEKEIIRTVLLDCELRGVLEIESSFGYCRLRALETFTYKHEQHTWYRMAA